MVTASTTPTSHIAADNDIVTAEIFIAAPRERVFQAITDPTQAVRWWGEEGRYRLSEFNMDLRAGGKWSCSGTSVTMGGPITIHGEFLAVNPPRELAYTWISSWLPITTEVVWRLEAHGSGTVVKLIHRGFAGNAEQAKNHSIGWSAVISWLQSFVEKGETVDTRK